MTKFSRKQNLEFWNKIDTEGDQYSGDMNIVKLEDEFLFNELKLIKKGDLLDIGCGKGQRTSIFSSIISGNVIGIDYSGSMISKAKLLESDKLSFEKADITKFKPGKKFDIVTSCRCLVNTPTDEEQYQIIKKLHSILKAEGHLIMIERSIQGLDSLNKLREIHGLKSIPERFHNHYINEQFLIPKLEKMFRIEKLSRLGLFYYISRVILPRMVFPREPSENHPINKIAIDSQKVMCNMLDQYGVQFMVHLRSI